jgi:hypothetical protein
LIEQSLNTYFANGSWQ